jgi:NADH-quinone oxidoreductase subunit C
MSPSEKLHDLLQNEFQNEHIHLSIAHNEMTLECKDISQLRLILFTLRDKRALNFNQMIDLCAVDYLHYGHYDWETDSASSDGFSRGVEPGESRACQWDKPRFAVVYHLLSTTNNQRLRVKVFVDEENLVVPSAHDIWKSALWFEREAYDLFGILFTDHPDLRRILTDYGFIGHPFRKDFPTSGHVEMRYDAKLAKVIYEPVSIEPRVTVPKVIRDDNRYLKPLAK